jgi:hypothetical protein
MKWEVLEHPDHSPGLVPFNLLMFGSLKNALRDSQFADDDDVKEAVNDWLRNQPIFFFPQLNQGAYRSLG